VTHVNPLKDLLETRSIKNICLTTGTPILNSPMDLYPLLHLCDPILFKSQANFENTYLTTNHHSGKHEFKYGALDNLKPLIEGRFLARKRAEAGIVTPKQRHHVVRVDLDPTEYPLQYRTIKQITDEGRIELTSGAEMTIMHLIALITRKRQANVWPAGIEIVDRDPNSPTFEQVIFSVGEEVQESVKMDAMMEKIRPIHAEGRRQLVFSQFTTGIDEFVDRLNGEGIRAVALTGHTSKALRERIRSNLNRRNGEEPEWDVVCANYKAGGTGLNFTAVTATHILDEEWNPGKRNQAYGRSDRIGQTEENDVYVYRIPASVDTWMSNTIQRKQYLIEGFEGVMKEQDGDMAENFKDALLSGDML
jgi:SNF2 family DNA or RNA helicase